MTIEFIPYVISPSTPACNVIAVDFSMQTEPSPEDRIIRGEEKHDSYIECLNDVLASGLKIELRYEERDQQARKRANELKEKLLHTPLSAFPRMISTVDLVVLTIEDNSLMAGLTRRTKYPFKEAYALPGGFIHLDADCSTSDTARRIAEQYGLLSFHLEQVITRAGPDRDMRGYNGWAMSVIYLVVIHPEQKAIINLKFYKIKDTGDLAFDHSEMLQQVQDRFIAKARYSTLLLHAMPETFLMNDLISAFREICNPSFDQASFRRKVADMGMVRLLAKLRCVPSCAEPQNVTGF
ncbi:NUDIX hydrolase [Acetobacter thailandicus]|uniref:NUDIX hydrolase n=1 Tax=Acetobacter thailandicus TaxID=1502842 RepID=UPI001BA52F1B|nr:NUDIX hydrolase [Acetobacter thailandicus]MBS0961347.1 NUDIX hydrolase [Acetobacter thailandicus]